SFLRDMTFAVSSYFLLKKQRGNFDIIQTHDKTLLQDIYRAGDGCHIEWLRQRWKRIGIFRKASIALNPYHWLILLLERMVLKGRRFKKIIAISEMVKKNIIDNYGVPAGDIEVIYNGVDTNKFHPDNKERYRKEIRQQYGLGENDLVALFVGSGFERKGVRYLIEAIEALSGPVTALIVGKGSEKKVGKISPNPSLPKRGNVRFPLWKRGMKGDFQRKQKTIFCGPQRDIRKYYAAADIFVFPTMYEPFGNVHLEALASGLPVITTRNSGASEIIKDGTHGFVVSGPEDTEGIANGIRAFINEPEKLQAMSRNARALAEEFTFDKHMEKMLALYETIRSGRG
ncbi:MAG: glycosyltransferase family 4 protein, partial [Nitrospirota bacterium]|nr:glycosyltransferase family 4 protein [Nitrospirota bacterium]